MTPVLIAVIVLAVAFGFLNGVHDSSNVVATMISSRAFSPPVALGTAAIAEFLGPYVFGTAVAKTIGNGIASSNMINTSVILAAMVSAIVWDSLTWYFGFPSSSSHALIGGILGAVVMAAGWKAIEISGLVKTLISLFASPIIGFVIGFLFIRLILILSWKASPRVNSFFKRSQILTGITLALSHGANDGPKTMGMIMLAIVIEDRLPAFQVVQPWVKLLSAFAIAAGTAVGGQKLIRTVGGKFYKIAPVNAFASQLSSAIVMVTASLTGGPVSATSVISSAIMGVGAGERANKVRWGVAQDIATAWLLTIPATALVAAGLFWIISLIIH